MSRKEEIDALIEEGVRRLRIDRPPKDEEEEEADDQESD